MPRVFELAALHPPRKGARETAFSYEHDYRLEEHKRMRASEDPAECGFIPEAQLEDEEFRSKQTHFINDTHQDR